MTHVPVITYADFPSTATPLTAGNINSSFADQASYTDTLTTALSVRTDNLDAKNRFHVPSTEYPVSGTDITSALQSAVTAAIAASGSAAGGATVVIDAPTTNWTLTDTITFQPASGTSMSINFVAEGKFNQITWAGGNTKSVFHSYGKVRSLWQNIKVRLPAAADSVVVFDVDADATRVSNSLNTYINCEVNTAGAVTNCTAWKVAGTGGGASEASNDTWINCPVTLTVNAGASPNVGFVLPHLNGKNFEWLGCGVSSCDIGYKASSSELYWHGCGGTANAIDFQLNSAMVAYWGGGRWELGKRWLDCPRGGSSAGGVTTVEGVMIASYAPTDNIIFNMQAAGSYKIDCCLANATAYTAAAFSLGTNATGLSKLVVSGRLNANDPAYTLSGTGNVDVDFSGACRANSAAGSVNADFSAMPTIASAATVTIKPANARVVTISGTANITSITATGMAGRIVTLIFSGTNVSTGLTNGSNLKIGANFVYTPDDAITLVCDGTNWFRAAAGAAN